MSKIDARLAALEQAATTKNGHIVFYCDERQPGVYWASPDRGCSDAPAFTQADVDKAGLTQSVIVVEYVARSVNHE